MQVTVLYFGVLKDLAGAERAEAQLADGASVADLLRLLREGTSKQSGVWKVLAVAVNREYADGGRVLAEGDEVALLPPVSGGSGER